MPSHGVFSRQKHIRDDCLSFVKCVCDVTSARGGGVLPKKILIFNGVKSCNFRQNKHMEKSTFMKQGIVCMSRKGITVFELGSDSDFSNIYTMYNTSERSEPEKNL